MRGLEPGDNQHRNNIRIDISFTPKAEVANYRLDTCRCLDCDRGAVPETGLIKVASLVSNILKMIVSLWRMSASYQGMEDLFGLLDMAGCGKSTIRHVPDAVVDRMCAKARRNSSIDDH